MLILFAKRFLIHTLAFWILFAAASALFFMAVSILGTTRRPMGDGLFISSTTLRAFTPFPLILTGLLNDCFSSSLSLCSKSYYQSLSNNKSKNFSFCTCIVSKHSGTWIYGYYTWMCIEFFLSFYQKDFVSASISNNLTNKVQFWKQIIKIL